MTILRIGLAALALPALVAAFMMTQDATPAFADCPSGYNKCVDGPELTVYFVTEILPDRGCVPFVRVDGLDDPMFTATDAEWSAFVWEGLYVSHSSPFYFYESYGDSRNERRLRGEYVFYVSIEGYPRTFMQHDGDHGFELLKRAVYHWSGSGNPIPLLRYGVDYNNHWGERESIKGWATLVGPPFLAETQMLKDCNRLLVETRRTMEQDRLHQTNLAIAQAKIDGAKALEEYYLSQLEPMRKQIAELEAIQSIVLEAFSAMRVQLDALYTLRVRYVEDMAMYAAQLQDETGKMAESMTNALARIELAVLNTQNAVTDIQADIDQIENDKAQIQALMQQAQDEMEKARQELSQLEASSSNN